MAPSGGFTLEDVREKTYKPRDSWWTVFLVDPVASRMVRTVANRTSITPDHLTISALVLGAGAAWSFGRGDVTGLVVGALIFHVSFLLDCMDGKIARLKGTGTVFGSWLDYVFDRLRVLICTIGLMGGQYAASGDAVFLWFALAIVFTDMFRYLNSPQMAKVRRNIRTSQRERAASALEVLPEGALVKVLGKKRFAELKPVPEAERAAEGMAPDDADPDEEVGAEPGRREPMKAPAAGSLAERFPVYGRFRAFLCRNRVRPHLFSGIEFQMGVFIVAPLAGAFSPAAMLVVAALSCAGLLVFEAFIVFRLWQSARRYERERAAIEAAVAGAASAVPAGTS